MFESTTCLCYSRLGFGVGAVCARGFARDLLVSTVYYSSVHVFYYEVVDEEAWSLLCYSIYFQIYFSHLRLIFVLFVLYLCSRRMWLLVQCKNLLHAHYYDRLTTTTTRTDDSTHHPKIHTFMEVARAALGSTGGRVVEIFLFVLQGGVCCVFLSLLSTNLMAALPFLSSTVAVFLVTIVISVMVLLRFLKDLVWLSASANSIMITAILTASVAGLLQWMRRDVNTAYDEPPPIISHRPLSAAITFTSDMFFAFEGIGLVLPIENSFSARHRTSTPTSTTQQQQQPTLSFDQILIRSMCVTAMLFLLVGLPAVFGFPDIQSGSVTAYLKERYPQQLWFTFINAMVMVAVALTFPLQLQPAVQVLDQWIDDYNDYGCCGATGSGSSDDEHLDLSSASDGDIEIERVSLHDGQRASPLQRRSSSFLSRSLSEHPSQRSHCCGSSEYTWLFRRWAVVLACAMIVLLVDDLGVLMALFGAVGQT